MTKEKPLSTKAKIRAEKEKEKRIATAIFLVSILLIVIFSAYFGYTFLNRPQSQTSNLSSELKAAIVDQLSLTFPNQTFIETTTNILKQAGYTIDYYPGEKVTVEFYKNLPTHGYRLIILRVHSALDRIGQPPLALFTSEPYSKTKYLYEQLTDRLRWATFSEEDWKRGIIYFGIMPGFVRSSNGRFDNTIIIMMGCNGLTYTDMAKEFVEKGAKTYISWSGSVSASHTDRAITHLLYHLISEKQTIKQAVENTNKEVGPDPEYKSFLLYYPLQAGDQKP